MNKLNQLRELLINDQGLGLQTDQLHIFADSGSVESHYDTANDNFKLKYKANIIITDYTGRAEHIIYVLTIWLRDHQPNHTDEPIQFEADILNDNAIDLSLFIDLTETIKANTMPDGIRLHTPPEPTLDKACPDSRIEQITIRQHGEPIAHIPNNG